MKRFFVLLLVAFPAIAIAEPATTTPAELSDGSRNLLDDVALNGAAGTRTFTLGPQIGAGPRQLAEFRTLVLEVDFTHDQDGTLSIACTEGQSTSAADFDLTTTTCSSGTCSLHFAGTVTTNSTLTADKKFAHRVGITGFKVIQCVVTHNGSPTASDKVTVTGFLAD